MLTLGATLKQLRLENHLTQNELYGGIISRSFAGRLERGEHDLGVEKFLAILDRLHVDATEFRFIQRDYHPTDATTLKAQSAVAYEQENFPWLSHLIQRYARSSDPDEQELAAIADVSLKAFDARNWTITPAMARFWHRLDVADVWQLNALELSTAWLAIAGRQHRSAKILSGIQKMHAGYDRYVSPAADPFHVADTRVSFDLVALQILIWDHQYAQARAFRTQLLTGPQPQLSTDGSLTVQATCCIWEWYFGDFQVADADAERLLQLSWIPAASNVHSLLTAYRQHAQRYHLKHPD